MTTKPFGSQRCAEMRSALHLSPIALKSLTIGFIFLSYNATFWSNAAEIFSGHLLSLGGFVAAVFFLMLGAFSFFAFPYVVKPFLVFIVLLSSVTSYYMDNLGVIIDRDMIQNVMVTTVTESKHLITFGFVTHVLIYGVLPAILILCVTIKPQGRIRMVVTPFASVLLSFGLAAGFLMTDLKSYASILRERKDLMSSFQPGAPLVGAIRYARMISTSSHVAVAAIGEDAVKGPAYARQDKPVLTIVVAGETARTQNFSLNGYEIDTNPRLADMPVISFRDVSSCGTATAVSLPCMFSRFGREEYSYDKGISHQNVLDVLTHAGVHVEWWDNNTGHKGIADRIQTQSFTHRKNDIFCAAGECMDGIFMEALQEYAAGITQDTVLVLHQIGSHGPTYYLRYPSEFERFTPACRTAEFKNCTTQEIVNAYDNTIAYTDEILAQTIEMLTAQEHLTTALLYVSDHGESLGEGGIYLHGAPYFMAPEDQTKVPMILWMSKGFQARFGHNTDCLADKADVALSHDNLFHSLLGMLDIETGERDPGLDIFASCRAAAQEAQG
jgi:lipid A ethanolaminephosphotransferase